MNIFDAMKEIASGSIQFAEFKLQEGVIRMQLDDAGYMTKMVRHRGEQTFHRTAIQRLSPSEYQADWSVSDGGDD